MKRKKRKEKKDKIKFICLGVGLGRGREIYKKRTGNTTAFFLMFVSFLYACNNRGVKKKNQQLFYLVLSISNIYKPTQPFLLECSAIKLIIDYYYVPFLLLSERNNVGLNFFRVTHI